MDDRTATKEAFVEALREKYSVYHAAHEAGIARSTAYLWRSQDPEFAAAWDEALEDAKDTLEQSLFERAVNGTEEPVFYQGACVGTVTRYSDTAAIFLLKGARPEKYRERQEISGPGGGPIQMQADLSRLSGEDLERLEVILAKADADPDAG